jgi:hypothetical protein
MQYANRAEQTVPVRANRSAVAEDDEGSQKCWQGMKWDRVNLLCTWVCWGWDRVRGRRLQLVKGLGAERVSVLSDGRGGGPPDKHELINKVSN